ncbi:MAG: hypothetical protein EON91_05680 [Brevundimonas sp.]|uniref:hypothetical protein n=1 Tax=Brevundimonas sp. TaxID=1871086 RepID=UPI00121709B8|nr:hypothetical protein [Brevundimonas sp.]RZJ18373.1 MAG: hypothetical protein EON91_05680 [Brevundimonas sp.]
MRSIQLATLVASLALTGCAMTPTPRVQGGQPFALPPAEADQFRIGAIHVEAAPRVRDRYAQSRNLTPEPGETFTYDEKSQEADYDFRTDFEFEVRQELKRCATGSRPLNAVILVDNLVYDDRLRSLVDGKGYDVVGGVVELTDPAQGDRIVARYRIEAGTNSGGLLTRILGDRLDAMAEEFGRALCMEAFGQNPRGHPIFNTTRG